MNVSLQNIDKVSAELTVKLEKADYQEKVDKELKSLRQKAQIPGFRKGMVPTSLIKKMYGKSVIAEVVNKALQEAVYNYIKDNIQTIKKNGKVGESAEFTAKDLTIPKGYELADDKWSTSVEYGKDADVNVNVKAKEEPAEEKTVEVYR